MKSIKRIQKILALHKDELRQRFKVKQIGIFGSYVKGKPKKRSDIDILIEFEQGEETFDNYMELKFFLEELFNAKIDLVMRNVLREEIKDDILIRG